MSDSSDDAEIYSEILQDEYERVICRTRRIL